MLTERLLLVGMVLWQYEVMMSFGAGSDEGIGDEQFFTESIFLVCAAARIYIVSVFLKWKC